MAWRKRLRSDEKEETTLQKEDGREGRNGDDGHVGGNVHPVRGELGLPELGLEVDLGVLDLPCPCRTGTRPAGPGSCGGEAVGRRLRRRETQWVLWRACRPPIRVPQSARRRRPDDQNIGPAVDGAFFTPSSPFLRDVHP